MSEEIVQKDQEPLTIRRANSPDRGDLEAIASLLEQRDGHSWTHDEVLRTLCDLKPCLCSVWLAFQGSTPVGLSTVFFRTLSGPSGRIPTAYWANLFVSPDLRRSLLYPRLVMSTLAGARESGATILFAGVRRKELSLAHQRLGFLKVDSQTVLGKPLRLFRVAGVHFKMPERITEAFSWLDNIFGWRFGIGEEDLCMQALLDGSEVLPDDLLSLFYQQQDGYALSRDREWVMRRVTRWKGKGPYSVLWIQVLGTTAAAAIIGQSRHEVGLELGIILDLAFLPGHEDAARTLLRAIEKFCRRKHVDLLLWLPSTPNSRALAKGYRCTAESYDLLVNPAGRISKDMATLTHEPWSFCFLDHDAF